MSDKEKPNTLRVVSKQKVVPLTLVGVSEKTLERVLEHLQENDKLFDHNVPDEWRDPTKEGLQEYLIRTYLQGNFEVTGEDAVKRYVKQYDFVAYDANGPGFQYEFYLKPGMKGVIKRVDLNREFPITALWEPCDEFPKEKELDHIGGDMSLLPKGIFRRGKTLTSKVEILSEAEPGRLLEPTQVTFKYSYYLPVGTRGIVTKIDKSAKFPVSVVFGNSEGYVPNESGVINCKYHALRLFRENRIDIRKLIGDFS